MMIAEKIKNARIQKGYTQEQVAEKLWFPDRLSPIGKMEKFEGNPLIDFMNGALPWVLLGLMLLLAILYLNKEEKA